MSNWPLRRPPKRPIKTTASPESDAYNPSENEAASPESEVYNPSENEVASPESAASGSSENEAAQSPRKKRVTNAKPPIGQKAAKNRPDYPLLDFPPQNLKASGAKSLASKPTIQPGQLIRGLQPSRLPNIAPSPATINLNNFHEALPRLSINPTAPFKCTPAEVRTVHVLESPIYNDRDFRLVDVSLEVTTHRNHWKTKAWRIRARDFNDPNKNHILQPFQIEANEEGWSKQKHGPEPDNPLPKVTRRIGKSTNPYAQFAESLRLSERAVPT